MKKWLSRRSSKCEPVENYLADPNDTSLEIVLNCAKAGPAEMNRVVKSIKHNIEGKDGKQISVGLHLLSLMVLDSETLAQAIATPKWMQRLVNLAAGTTKTFVRQQIVASVAKWASLYMNNPMLYANFEWANKKLNMRFEQQVEPDAAVEETKAADKLASKGAAAIRSQRMKVERAESGDKVSARLQSSSASVGTSRLSESTEKIRQSIRSAIDADHSESVNTQAPHLLRRGSFSSLNPGVPLGNSESGIVDQRRGQNDFLLRCLQQVPSLMILNDATLEDIYNPNATTSMEELAEDIELLANFQEDIRAISGWNILNKDNDDHLVLLQCSYLFGETARLWRKKLSGAETGDLALDVETLVRPGSAEKKRRGKLDTSVAKEALTALEQKQNLEKRIEEMLKQNAASQNDILRMQAKLADTEFLEQKKTATFQETIAELLDEIESLKSELQNISKIPREKLLLWALKEKELGTQDGSKNSVQQRSSSHADEFSSLQHDASKSDVRNCFSAEADMQKDEFRKLEMDFKKSQVQLKECEDKLRLQTEEVLLMRLKMKESGGQNQSVKSSYIANLEDTITSLSEELSGLKHDLKVANDLSQNRFEDMSSQALLRHQKRFLSDRNALIATHGKLMVSMARMSGSFSSEIRSQLLILRGNVSRTRDLLQSDLLEAIEKLGMYSISSVSSLQRQHDSIKTTDSPKASSSITSPASSLATTHVSAPIQLGSQAPKKEKGFFSSLFGKVSQTKADTLQASISPANAAHQSSEIVATSPTAHLKTVFAQAKGAVEAQEALQLKSAAEAHAAALVKVEEEWKAAANAKVEAESRKLMEINEANETAAMAQTVAEAKSAAEFEFAAEARIAAEATVIAVKHDVAEDSGDVSSFSDDDPLNSERVKNAAESHEQHEDGVALTQTTIATTLEMNVSQSDEDFNPVEIAMPTRSINVNVPKERRNKLRDRPASAEATGSKKLPSEIIQASFMNNVMIEDAGDSVQMKGRNVLTVAEKTGRKVLAGTSKSNLDMHSMSKEVFLDISQNSVSAHSALSHGATAQVLSAPAVDKKVRLIRVSTSNRLPQNLKTVKTKEAEDEPQPTASDVYSTTAQNLKKMRDRIAKAQMPNEDVESTPSGLNPATKQDNESSAVAEMAPNSSFHMGLQRDVHPRAASLDPSSETTLFQKDHTIRKLAAFTKSSPPAQHLHASLEDWNVEDL